MIKAFKFFMLVSVMSFYACGSDSIEGGAASASIAVEASANEVGYGEGVTFTLQNVTESDIASVCWDFGDGETSDAFAPSHAYRIPDDYTVVASVTLSTGEVKEYKTLVKVFAEEINSTVRLSIPESLTDRHYQVCAHRGYWKEAPENSVSAIEKAIQNGIDFIEIDVRMTEDNELVLMHNATIDETTNGTGKVSDLTFEEIKSYYLYFDGRQTMEHVPSLAEALMAARGKIYVDIDMKISDYRSVYNIVKQCGMLSQCMFTVYELQDASNLLNIDKTVNVFPVVYTMDDLDGFMSLVDKLAIVQFNSEAWKNDILEKAYSNGIAGFMNVYVNDDDTPYTDNYQKVNRFVSLGGTVAQTDFPVELKKYLDNLKRD
ncbi:hypothetical protein EVD32_09060 [Bacteroidales bacterium SW299]|nr:hypothetical protein [Bacteroidales bacterium SW299]